MNDAGVYRSLANANYMARPHSANQPITEDLLRELYEQQGLNQVAIAQHLGVCKQTVAYWMKQFGIAARKSTAPHNLTGQIFGLWTAIKPVRGRTRWLCRCACGVEKEVFTSSLVYGTSRSCGNHQEATRWTGHEAISGSYWGRLQAGATARGLTFALTLEEAWDQFTRQAGRCALTGLPLDFVRNYAKNSTQQQTASLDRIDATLSYNPDNIQWVHKEINRMRGRLSVSDFIQWCRLVSQSTQVV